MPADSLEFELELIRSTLLPAEHLTVSEDDKWPRTLDITSDDSKLALRLTISEGYANPQDVFIEIRGAKMGREEAESWAQWVRGRMADWDADSEYPLYQLLATHFLPLLAPSSAPSPPVPTSASLSQDVEIVPHHALLTSHHLLAPSKRKDLHTLSSQLSLVGFAKTGHPGIMYARGTRDDLIEWVTEVKTWQWLALRVRVTPEPTGDVVPAPSGRGKEDGARGGKGRGEWTEVEKVGEAVEWMRKVGQEKLLTDFGIGVGSDHA